MKKTSSLIFILLIVLLALTGLAAFFWRDDAYQALDYAADIDSQSLPEVSGTAAKDTIDTTILKDARFTNLKDTVEFEAADICHSAVGKRQVEVIVNGATTTKSEVLTCVQGNNVPFRK
jgi:flagellar basal body-associated protein FliL